MRTCILLFLSLTFSLSATPGFFEPWGKDADLRYPAESIEKQAKKNSPLIWCAERVIWFHQNILSPVDGPRSHFRPSSSGYMLEAIQKYGFFKGYIMGCDRLLRENSDPWIYKTVEYEGRTLKWNPP